MKPHAATNDKRSDLVFYNMPETNKVVIGDIRITCPIPVSANTSLSLNKAREPDRATAASRREKENKYDATCANNGFEFQTIISLMLVTKIK